ncbi:hypothetical protein KR215_005863 [Drosophila sulfurigaster]|nr:hypothetical protein KR215_005863 [Drosophila sulfurigaster]
MSAPEASGKDLAEHVQAVILCMLKVVDAGLNLEALKASMELLDVGIQPRVLGKMIKLLQKDAKAKK